MSAARPALAIVGAGGLARAFASALSRSGRWAVTIASRRPATATALARETRGAKSARRIQDAVAGAGVVLLAVPDKAIGPLARQLGPMRASWRGVVVLHAAGAYGPEILAPLQARGAAAGVLHPLAVLGSHGGVALSGAFARVEGHPKARAAALRLCVLLGCVPLRAPGLATPRGRGAYHAAASLASNDLVALLAASRDLLVRYGVPKRAAGEAVATLAEGALRQVRRSGLSGALTGPVARNDAETLRAQLRALDRDDPEVAGAHRALSLRLVAFAAAGGRLDADAAAALRRLLRRGRHPGATV